jgi:carbamoyl-phosphate synthase large subunit
MTTVFLTAIGGDIAQNIAKIIRSHFPDWLIVGSDIHERHGGALYVDKLVLAPRAVDQTYKVWIEEQIDRHDIDLIFPLSEAEIDFFYTDNDHSQNDELIVGASKEIIEIGRDKLDTANFIKSIGLSSPWTVSSDGIKSIPDFPCIYKPRKGQGSKNIFICKDKEDAGFYSKCGTEAVFQEYLLPEDKEVTCALYRFKDGKLAILQLLRCLVGGTTNWAKVIDNREIRKQCEAIADALQFFGPANVQLRLTDNGPRIFEINPRFSSTVLMRHELGFTDVVWALQEKMGVQPIKFQPPVDQEIVKIQEVSLLH